ncbi:MAG: hypothetical protein OEW23_01250 [Candidatus Aminicenantes bacterium]|nr:hypothetical protein [Candidatus Aminicenantes bacterium]
MNTVRISCQVKDKAQEFDPGICFDLNGHLRVCLSITWDKRKAADQKSGKDGLFASFFQPTHHHSFISSLFNDLSLFLSTF